MSINLTVPNNSEALELKPRITVIGVGGAGGNAVNNMIQRELGGVDFVATNTDAQALSQSKTDHRIQLGANLTQGLGAGAKPEIGRAAAEEAIEDVLGELKNSHMAFVAAGMGGGTGTGAAPVIARAAREAGILTVGVVTKPFQFEGSHRMALADQGIEELEQYVDTLIIIPNQNLFRIANESTTFADAFAMADQVLYSGVRGVTDLITMPGLINLDFADIRSVMSEMGKAMMGTGEAEGERRALDAAEAAIANPLLEDTSMKGAKGVLINITGSEDITLFEVDEAATRIRSEVDDGARIIVGSAFDPELKGVMRVSVVATGIDVDASRIPQPITLNVPTETHQPVLPAAEDAIEILSIEGPVEEPEAPLAAGSQPVEAEPKAEVVTETEKAPSFSALERIIATAKSDAAKVQSEKSDEPAPEPATREGLAASRESKAPIAAQKPEVTPAPVVAAPTMGATDAFIPPKPAMPVGPAELVQPDPFRAADLTNGASERKPEADDSVSVIRKPSLFERVTRSGRAAIGMSKESSSKSVAPEAPKAQVVPDIKDTPTSKGGGLSSFEAVRASVTQASPPAHVQAAQGQSEMAGLAPARAPEESEDEDQDDLDIPAFLRRQAN